MPTFNRPLFRLAQAMQKRYEAEPQQQRANFPSEASWLRCIRFAQRMAFASKRGWNRAEAHTKNRLQGAINQLLAELRSFQSSISSQPEFKEQKRGQVSFFRENRKTG